MAAIVERPSRGALDTIFLESQAAQGNVKIRSVGRFDQQDPALEGKVPGSWITGVKIAEQQVRPLFVIHEIGEQAQVGIFGEPRLAPALDRHPADETVVSAVLLQISLDLDGSLKNRPDVHELS